MEYRSLSIIRPKIVFDWKRWISENPRWCPECYSPLTTNGALRPYVIHSKRAIPKPKLQCKHCNKKYVSHKIALHSLPSPLSCISLTDVFEATLEEEEEEKEKEDLNGSISPLMLEPPALSPTIDQTRLTLTLDSPDCQAVDVSSFLAGLEQVPRQSDGHLRNCRCQGEGIIETLLHLLYSKSGQPWFVMELPVLQQTLDGGSLPDSILSRCDHHCGYYCAYFLSVFESFFDPTDWMACISIGGGSSPQSPTTQSVFINEPGSVYDMLVSLNDREAFVSYFSNCVYHQTCSIIGSGIGKVANMGVWDFSRLIANESIMVTCPGVLKCILDCTEESQREDLIAHVSFHLPRISEDLMNIQAVRSSLQSSDGSVHALFLAVNNAILDDDSPSLDSFQFSDHWISCAVLVVACSPPSVMAFCANSFSQEEFQQNCIQSVIELFSVSL